ncbi:MAG: hypothetical protein U0N52_06130 [Muribaculaceae bacterium]
MKHLITRLLLVMICACAIPTAGNAFTLTIAGNANFMDSKTAQSSTFTLPGVSQTTSGNSSDFYFWAIGEFKLSQAGSTTDWETFNNSALQITATTLTWGKSDVNSNVGGSSSSPKFIHLHIELNKDKVEVQDEPFAGHEGVWSTTPFEEGETIYYFPNENFKSSDAIFRAVFNGGTTVLCHNYEFNPDYYTFTVPKEGLTAVKIERGKADQSNWWGNFTAELKSKDKGSNNCITMDSDNRGNWSSAPSSWTYYEPLTGPATYTSYFYSRSNESEAWQPQTLVPEYGKCSFTLSDLSGKQFAIRMDVNGVQRYWLIPATAIDFTTTKSYSLTSTATTNSCTFPSEAPKSDYTFVIEFNGKKPSRLRVNPTAAAYNQTLFVGIASSNRHQIQYNEDTKTYEDYKFYVNKEDLDNDGKFGFRFYSEPNGGVWMGNNELGKVFGTDFNFDTEITTSGIKRYFLKETGAYAINVKSYEPETNTVVFSLSKLADDAFVTPELYIHKTGDTGRTRIESSEGKYKPFKIENVIAGTKFCFYSAATDGNRMGPVYTADLNVDTEGTLPYTTIGADRNFKLAEAGTYIINVSEYLADDNKVTFTVTKEPGSSVPVPKTLYLRNSRNGDGAPIAMTRQDGAGDNDRNTCKFFAEVDYNANEDFQFNFIEKNESNWPDRGIVCYPSANELSVSANTPARIDNVGTCTDNPDKAWSYNSTEGGKITVSVYFKKNGYATVEVVGNSDKNYYFIGDMNNWFSNEFDGDLGGTDKNGETIARGINATRWEADKDNWKLEYVGDGWYRFDSFPGNLLSGHFQIVSNGSWELKDGNEIYSHVIYINPEDVKANKMSDYRAFKMNRITREDITKGREYRVRKRSADVSGGSNLGTQCNAVENAVFWFNPGNDTEAPRIRITGTPKDYFIFYNMAGENVEVNPDMKSETEYWVRAAINSGKPNTNNYFLAGIEYGDYTLPFYDINGNTGAHMNVNEGIDLAPYDLKNMTERELNNLFFNNSDIVNSILNEDKLPNGRDISVYDKVWIAKIPSGFENPAGTKYNMTFNKAMTDADRKATRTLTTRHYYFFPQQAGLHVHVNIDEILAGDKVESAEVAYRLYKTDNQYNTIAILHGSDVTAEGHRKTEILHKVGSALPLTKDSEATNGIGWYECEEHSITWDAPSNIEGNWRVSWIGDETTGARREVAYDDNSAFVQFRLTIKMKQPASRAAEGEGETQVYYLPERVDVANDANHYWFENSDLYAKLKASDLPDGVLTGISEIVEDTDNGPAVYYNLQGVRVDNPAAGNIYIKVTRKGSEKILF